VGAPPRRGEGGPSSHSATANGKTISEQGGGGSNAGCSLTTPSPDRARRAAPRPHCAHKQPHSFRPRQCDHTLMPWLHKRAHTRHKHTPSSPADAKSRKTSAAACCTSALGTDSMRASVCSNRMMSACEWCSWLAFSATNGWGTGWGEGPGWGVGVRRTPRQLVVHAPPAQHERSKSAATHRHTSMSHDTTGSTRHCATAPPQATGGRVARHGRSPWHTASQG
jgi:hypothetical protein